jgi:putative SOS response-associated peptidase YedK
MLKFDGVRNSQLPSLTPRYNIAPSQEVLAITESQGRRELPLFLWGLIPSWSKDLKGFINARSETLEEKPSFSESFQNRRCLIPADGFYEWKRNGKSKQPYYFQLKDEAPFAFAGLWDEWHREGVSITSCSIVTTMPNELLATIHDRMPVILGPEAQDTWLRDDVRPAELKSLLVPFPASAMQNYPVTQQVNRAQAEDAQLVEPIDLSQEATNWTLF